MASASPDPARTPDLAALFQRHRDSMWRAAAAYLRKAGLDPQTAQDAVATVMARLARKMPNPTPSNWEAYLVRAAVNAARDEVKKEMRRPDHPGASDDVSISLEHPAPNGAGEDDVVAEAVDRARLVARVREALATLPPDERRAVEETLMRARTNVEVGAEMGVTGARVSQLKTAGIRRLAPLLEGEWVHDRR